MGKNGFFKGDTNETYDKLHYVICPLAVPKEKETRHPSKQKNAPYKLDGKQSSPVDPKLVFETGFWLRMCLLIVSAAFPCALIVVFCKFSVSQLKGQRWPAVLDIVRG